MGDGASAGEDQDTVTGILGGIMPPAITEEEDPVVQEEIFTDIVVGLLAAADIYQTLGDTLITDPAAGNEDVTGGTLVSAAVAGLVDLVVTEFMDPEVQDDPAEAAAVLWDIYLEGQNEEPDITDIVGFNENAEFSTEITDITYLQNIATTAGIDIVTLFGSTPEA
jgi:hypothetical protein